MGLAWFSGEAEGADVLVPFLIRAARVGVQSTFLALVPVAAYAFVAPPGTIALVPYVATVVVGLLGAALIWFLPWEEIFARGHGTTAYRLWSVADIALVTILIAASGGADSPLWAIYMLTTLFFAATYALPTQVAMLAFTIASYLAAIAYVDGFSADLAPAITARLGILVVVAFMASFLTFELKQTIVAHAVERARSQARAERLQRVADAARTIHSLETTEVFDAVVEAAASLGYDTVGIALLEADGHDYRVVAARGLPDELVADGGYRGRLDRQEYDGAVRDVDDVPDAHVAGILDSHGHDTVVNAPIHRGGQVVGFLAASRAGAAHAGDDVEAFETLAALAGRALENAHLFRLKTDFIANVSHELRTPLTVLVGLSDTLQRYGDQVDENRRVELLERLRQSALRLSRTITALLDFTSLEARQGSPVAAQFDIAAIVTEVVESHASVLESHDVAVSRLDSAIVQGNPALIERVISNLVRNAATHTPPDAKIRIDVTADDTGATVSVEDDGPGIPADEISLLKERFYRGGDHLTRRPGGLGLGLALAEEILELHESSLEIHSAVGQGTRFAFRLAAAEGR